MLNLNAPRAGLAITPADLPPIIAARFNKGRGLCTVFLKCPNTATTTIDHPLGQADACESCAAWYARTKG